MEQVYDREGSRKVTETFDNKVVFGNMFRYIIICTVHVHDEKA